MDEAPVLARLHQAAAVKERQMERQGRRQHAEVLADRTGENPVRPRLDEKTEDRQTRLVAERGQLFERRCNFHISENIETYAPMTSAARFSSAAKVETSAI